MRMALAEAQKAADHDEIPVGAVIVAGKTVISRAYNLTETLTDPTAHAEMQAITAAANLLGGKYLTGCTLYVTVEPCAMCAGALIQSRIRTLYYGTADLKAGAAGSVIDLLENKIFNHKVKVVSGILETESSEMLKQFFRQLRS